MYQIPIFILGGCAALLIEKIYKKELTQSKKAINVKENNQSAKKVSHETINDHGVDPVNNNGDHSGDHSGSTEKTQHTINEDIPNVD